MANEQDTAPGVLEAQFTAFASKMPAYYSSLVATMLATVFVFHRIAPTWLACGVPIGASLLGVARGLWWFVHRNDQVDAQRASQYLRRSTRTLIVAAVIVIATDLRLFTYGDVHARYFLLMQMMTAAMCGFYCLMHLRTAALWIFAAVFVPFSALAASMHRGPTILSAATCAVTAAVMIFTMMSYQRDFVSLVQVKAETLQLSEDNLRLAHLDMVTGLPNRRRFFDLLHSMQRSAARPGDRLCVGIIDLDGFKPVNDTYGHTVGDGVLTAIAARLTSLSSEVLHLCRLGGDEFGFLLHCTEPEAVHQLGQTIIESVRRPLQIDERTICVGCSLGFACSPDAGEVDGLHLFEQADYALYHAKRSGRARSVLFSDEHQTLIRTQSQIEQTLRSADFEAEFYPLFQPIVDLKTNQVTAFESLARWQSPTMGSVSPGVFIPVAEHTGIISELTLVLLQKSLHAAESWPEHIGLSFNVSPFDISSYEKMAAILATIQASGVAPSRVAIELTETALLRNFAETSTNLTMIRSAGVSISLDDFGTGHSSLSYIHALPLDKIKVDRSFVQNLQANSAGRNIVRSVITLCRDLGLHAVIEGVETQPQLDLVEHFGANLIQGYLFSRPMPANEIDAYLAVECSFPSGQALASEAALGHSFAASAL